MIVWDTSALIKCYGLEADHERAVNLLTRERGHAGCVLLRLETTSALSRRIGSGRALRDSLIGRAEDHLKLFDLLPLDSRLLDLGIRLILKHSLRATDSLHLAAAILLAREVGRRKLHFATADAEQAEAAAAENLKVLALAR
jgi:predicted nucleic acid-binding protein